MIEADRSLMRDIFMGAQGRPESDERQVEERHPDLFPLGSL